MPSGKSAVVVYGINTEHRFRSQPAKDVKSFVIEPGTYLLDVDCMRPGAGALVDGSFDFVFTVEADKSYLLDCAPQPNVAGNGFYVSERGT